MLRQLYKRLYKGKMVRQRGYGNNLP